MNATEPRVKTVSAFLKDEPHIGRKKLYELIKDEKIPSFRLGRKILLNSDEVFEALRQNVD